MKIDVTSGRKAWYDFPMIKRNFKALSIVASIFLLAACSGKEKSSSSSAKNSISFMLVDYDGNPLSGEHAPAIIKYMEDWTKSKIEFQFVPNDGYKEKMKSTLKSSDMPMIMHIDKMGIDIVEAANNGKFWDLNEFIWDSSKYPNLSKMNKDICKSLNVNGQLIGLYKARDIGRNGLSYRKDWAEKLGIPEPKTPEDIYNMMHAFTYDDPDGNGEDDTYGLAMCSFTGPFDIAQTWFDCGNGWIEENGNLVPIHQTAAYKDALDWFRKLYADRVMPQNWRELDTKGWQDQVKKGKAGVFIDVMDGGRRIWDGFISSKMKSVVNENELASMELVGAINGKTLATAGYNGFLAITKAAKTREQVEACLHYIDKMCDDEMIILAAYGLKNINYEIDKDGYLVDTDAKDKSASKAYAPLNQTQCFVPHVLNQAKPSVKNNPRKIKELEVISNNEKYAVFNPALSYLANSETYSKKGSELDSLISEARTKYICCEMNEADLQAAFDKWNKLGGTAVISEVNEQYRANKE